MNLVVGATGLLGSEICRLLAATGKPVRAMVRDASDPPRVQRLKMLGAELTRADLKDPQSLRAACSGAEAVISTASSTLSRQEGDSIESVDLRGQVDLVDAARESGVKHFVFVSIAEMHVNFPLQDAKHTAERRIFDSGLRYTILRPTFFMEVWLSPALGFDLRNGKAQIYGSGTNRISWISYRDVAQFAVAALDNPAGRNAVLPLGGPEPLSPIEVVGIFEQVFGRELETSFVLGNLLQEGFAAAADPLQKSFAALMLHYAAGDVIDMTALLSSFPIHLTSVKDFAQQLQAGPSDAA